MAPFETPTAPLLPAKLKGRSRIFDAAQDMFSLVSSHEGTDAAVASHKKISPSLSLKLSPFSFITSARKLKISGRCDTYLLFGVEYISATLFLLGF